MQRYYAVWCFVSDSDEKQRFLDENILAIWWDKIWDLTQFDSIDEIETALKDKYPKEKSAWKYAFKNFINLKKGDRICLKKKSLKKDDTSTTLYAVWELKKWFPEWYSYEEWYGHKLDIDWKVLSPELKLDWVVYGSTLQKITQDDIQKEIDDMLWEWIYEIFNKYFKENSGKYLKTEDYKKASESRKVFLSDYPLKDFSEIELEDYVIGSGSKDTLCYWFEFWKYRFLWPRIWWGSAWKYGIYYSKEKNTYVDRHVHEIENYQKARESLKKIILNLVDDVKNAKSYEDFDDGVEELKNMQLPLTKLLNAYCPEKIIWVAAWGFIRKLANVFHIHYDKNITSIQLNYLLNESILSNLPNLKWSDPDVLAHMVRSFPEWIESQWNDRPVTQEENENSYSKYDFLNEVFMSESQYDEISDTLLRKKNIILMGAPWVWKTFCAKKLMYSIMGEHASNRIVSVQFHQSYSYEDFIQWYRPTDKWTFKLEEWIFYHLVEDARKEYESALERWVEPKKYCIIIDEINRWNLSKVFWELMMLIESDKRSKDWAVKLTYSKSKDKDFYIPANLYIIWTMNTADRSLTMVDYALRRRFAFIELEPAFWNNESAKKLKNRMINHDLVSDDFIDSLIEKYARLNRFIESNLWKWFRIWHSYFVWQNLSDDPSEIYDDILNYEIKPLLEEYYYDDQEKVKEALWIIENI